MEGAASGGESGGVTAGVSTGESTSAQGTEQGNSLENASEQRQSERKRLSDQMKTFFPDKEFSDDEAEDEAVKYMTELSEYRTKNKEANKKILDIFDAEPVVVDIMRDMTQGATFMEAIARHVDIANLQPQEGDPDHEKWTKALSDREAKRKEKETMAKKYDENHAFTAAELRAFAEETGLMKDNAKFEQFADKVNKLLQDAFEGRIDRNFFNLLHKGLNFDKAVETAKAQGEVKGKNEKIKATIQKETGDGLPTLREAGEMTSEPPKELTAEERLMKEIDAINARRKPLESLLQHN